MSSPKQLNPADTANFRAKMAVLPPDAQADIALKWRERFVASAQGNSLAPNPAETNIALGVGTVYSGLMGAWDGHNAFSRQGMVEKWQQETAPELGVDIEEHPEPFKRIVGGDGQVIHEGMSDPRDLFGVNRTLYPTFLLGLLAAFRVGGTRVHPSLVASAMAGTSYTFGQFVREKMVARMTKKQAEERASTATAEANPRWRYPRAA